MANSGSMDWKQHRTPNLQALIERDLVEAGLIEIPTFSEEFADEPTEGCPICVEQGTRCVCCQASTAGDLASQEADFQQEVWHWEMVEDYGPDYDPYCCGWWEKQQEKMMYAADCEIEALLEMGEANSQQAQQEAKAALEQADWMAEYALACGECWG